MHFGFFVTVHAGQIEFRLFGDREAGRPPLVTLARRGDCCLALMGRLDYQDDLRAQMGDGKQSVRADDDGALALAAYERWGEEAIGRLEGEFSLVLYDARQDLLLAARDPQGGYPLFWTTDRGVIALASSLRPILDLLPQRSLNPEFLAEYQMLPVPAFQEVPLRGQRVSRDPPPARRHDPPNRDFPQGKPRSESTGIGWRRSKIRARTTWNRSRKSLPTVCVWRCVNGFAGESPRTSRAGWIRRAWP